MNIENDIKVSVCVVTYNQENYIAECLESLVTQQTNFRFEIIVGEDCSTDSTRSIVQDYLDKYPNLIKPIFHEKNVGAVENLRLTYLSANGKYIAHMDGDDLALPNKLQTQYDILCENDDIEICTHSVGVVDSIEIIGPLNSDEYDIYYYLETLPFFAHSSKMFLKVHLDNFINKNENYNKYDFELSFESVKKSNIYHTKLILGKYRKDVGVYMNPKVKKDIDKRKVKLYMEAYKICKNKRKVKKIFIKYCMKKILKNLIYLDFKSAIFYFNFVLKNW